MKRKIYSLLFLLFCLLLISCKKHCIDDEYEYVITNNTGLLCGFKEAHKKGYSSILVKNGLYDLIEEYKEEFGERYFEKYLTGYNDFKNGFFDTGIFIENMKVKFEVGSKVVCNYDGDNMNVKNYFSAFSTGNNVIIDGLVLESSELRYGIHADFNTGKDESYMIIKNCDLSFYDYKGRCQVLGCGLGEHVNWIIEDNYFHSDYNEAVLRIHNNVSSDSQSRVVLRNNYIDGKGYFLFNNYSSSKLITNIYVYGNSWISAPKIGYETVGSYDNIKMIEYNNETRISYEK